MFFLLFLRTNYFGAKNYGRGLGPAGLKFFKFVGLLGDVFVVLWARPLTICRRDQGCINVGNFLGIFQKFLNKSSWEMSGSFRKLPDIFFKIWQESFENYN